MSNNQPQPINPNQEKKITPPLQPDIAPSVVPSIAPSIPLVTTNGMSKENPSLYPSQPSQLSKQKTKELFIRIPISKINQLKRTQSDNTHKHSRKHSRLANIEDQIIKQKHSINLKKSLDRHQLGGNRHSRSRSKSRHSRHKSRSRSRHSRHHSRPRRHSRSKHNDSPSRHHNSKSSKDHHNSPSRHHNSKSSKDHHNSPSRRHNSKSSKDHHNSKSSKDRQSGGNNEIQPNKLKSGKLNQYGYYNVENISLQQRKLALKNALRDMTPLDLAYKLHGVATLTKNTNPNRSKIFKDDADWIKKRFEKINKN